MRTPRNRSITAEGVYNNAHFMHAATSQVGNVVRLKTASGIVWEGIFKTFSSNFDVVLEVAAKVSNPDGPNASIMAGTVVDKLIFKPRDILHIVAKDVDLEYATRDTFRTDAEIASRLNGLSDHQRELEPWDASAADVNGEEIESSTILELDSGTANGWDADDMFRKNEQDYGVQSTFDHSLSGYTVPLQHCDSADYKEIEAKANQIANEIENQPQHKARLELENGDEETAYSAVVRPGGSAQQDQRQNDQPNGKYIPPAKRKNQSSGKLVRSTPPPSQAGTPSPKSQFPMPVVPSPMQHVQMPPPQMQVPQQPQAPSPTVMPNPPMLERQNSHPQQQVPQPQPLVQQQHMPPPVQMPMQHHVHPKQHHQPHQYGQGGRNGGGMPPNLQKQHSQNGDGKQMQRPPRSMYQQSSPPNMQHQQQMQPPPSHHHQQRDQIAPPMAYQSQLELSREISPKLSPQVKDLQSFAQEFQLAAPPVHKDSHQPPPQVSLERQQSPTSQQPQQHIPPMNKPPPQSSPPQPSTSPNQDSMDKVTNTLKKSTLNPNAKEFVLNPSAKPFQPRSPSTPSLSRPHTPQTPSHTPYLPAPVNGSMGQTPTSVIMPMGYMMTTQQFPQQPQGNRLRKVPMGQMRTDVASQMQVAAATGQPLLAPAPIQPFVYAAQTANLGPAQGYPQMHTVRVFESPPQLQYLPPNASQAASPAQPPPYGPGMAYSVAGQGPGQGGPPQQYQTAGGPPPPQGHQAAAAAAQFPLMCNLIPAQPHMMQGMQYIPQAPPPQHPIPLILQHQHPQAQHGPA